MGDDNSYKVLIRGKPLSIRFDKVDGFIRTYDGTRYLVLFGPENQFSLLCKNQNWFICFFTYRKNIDFA